MLPIKSKEEELKEIALKDEKLQRDIRHVLKLMKENPLHTTIEGI